MDVALPHFASPHLSSSPLQVIVAEARGRRAGAIDKEIAEATIKAQQASLAEEKEVVHRHRLSAELLAQLSEKVGGIRVHVHKEPFRRLCWDRSGT